MKRSILFFSIILMLSSVTSCNISSDISNDEGLKFVSANQINTGDIIDRGPVRGGVLKLYCTIPDTLNPILTKNVFVQDFSGLIYESLVKLDKNQKPIPVLADTWEVSNDGLVWTFHIRENVKWHDGMPLVSEDVEFTLKTILDNNIDSVYKGNFKNIKTFASVSRNKFRIILQTPNSFTAEMMTFPIIPKHYFAGKDIINASKNMIPTGTGPYKFVSYNAKKEIIMTANDNWWNSKNNEKELKNIPYIEKIEVKVYENSKESINVFQTSDIDITSIEPNIFNKFFGRTDLTIKKYPGRNYEFIALNLSKKVLKEEAVRKAIAYSIDKSKIINENLPGEAVDADIPIIPGTWLYDTNVVFYKPDIGKAKEILSQGGWNERKGIMYKSINGVMTPLVLEMVVNSDNASRVKVAETIKKQLNDTGINLTIKKVNWNEEMKLIDSKKFDMVLIGCSISSIPDISFMYSSSETSGNLNISGYKNAAVDNYLREILSENDISRKKAMFTSMRDIINDDVPYIGLYFLNDVIAYNKKIKGDINPYLWNKYNDIIKWYIPAK